MINSFCNKTPIQWQNKTSLTAMIYSLAMINLYFNYKLFDMILDFFFQISNRLHFNMAIYFAYKPLFCIWLYSLPFDYIYAITVQLNG